MKIWIDFNNSPHVLFFRPVIRELQARGILLEFTTRAYAQTVPLADKYGLSHTTIGKHGGRNLLELARQNYLRALMLARWAKRCSFDLALSHNSYAQVLAARLLGIPAVTLMDYEHQPLNHLCFRLASRVIVPEAFPAELLRRYGAERKTVRYPGVKEQVYLSGFKPDPDFLSQEGLPADKILLVIRPPAPWTAYHRFENDCFDQLLQLVTGGNHRYLLFLPRLAQQRKSVESLPGVHVSDRVYDGPNLLYHADLVISGGGTMNREAAVLGTPAYTVFKGQLGAVDRYLIEQGRMVHIQSPLDFGRIHIVRKNGSAQPLTGINLVPHLVDQILA